MHVHTTMRPFLIVIALVLLTGISLSLFPTQKMTGQESITIDFDLSSVPEEMRDPIKQLIEHRPPDMLPGKQFAIVSLRVLQDWALATLAVLDTSPEDVGVGKNGALIILHKSTDDNWIAVLEGTDEFVEMLDVVPDELLDPIAKQTLDPSKPPVPGLATPNMKFPWDSSQRWTVTQDWHLGNNIDLAPSGSEPNKWVLAAHNGTVTRVCNGPASANVEVTHSDGTKTSYVHLDRNSISSAILGQPVTQGRVLGRLYQGTYNPGPCGDTCSSGAWYCQLRDACGCSTGPHIHFGVPSRNLIIDGWNIDSLQAGTWYSSSNARHEGTPPDTTPPTGGYTEPADGTVIGNSVILRGTASDNAGGSGVERVEFRAHIDGVWQTVGTDRDAPYEYTWNVAGLSDRTITLGFDIFDRAGNAARSPQGTRTIIKNTAPPTINFTTPELNRWYNTNQRIDWTVSDPNGVWGFSQAWDTTPSGPPPQYPNDATGWLDFTNFDLSEGQHIVRVRAWDNAPDHKERAIELGWIGYDITAPTANATLNYGWGSASSLVVPLDLTPSDAHSGVSAMRLGDTCATLGNWQPFQSRVTWQLTGQQGSTAGVCVQFHDRAGNVSPMVERRVQLNFYPAQPASASYRLTTNVTAMQGAAPTSSNYRLNSTTGETLASGGAASSAGYRATLGFWGVVGSRLPVPGPTRPRTDFDGDGKSDILWRNTSSGANTAWLMNGFTRTSGALATSTTDWKVVGTGDFNGDGKADILWRNFTDGRNTIWLMNRFTHTAGAISTVGTGWVVGSVGDFNGDGKADILWRNTSDGRNTVWLMNGFTRTSGALTTVSTGWQAVGTGDFNGDGRSDLLWRNTSDGRNTAWLMNGFTYTAGNIAQVSTLAWKLVGTGDFNADGKDDLLWRRTDTGANSLWFMNGFSRTTAALGSVSVPNWKLVGTGDYNGDRKADILWRNAATGANTMWLMNGATPTAGSLTAVSVPNWKVVGTGGYDYDGSGVVGPAASDEPLAVPGDLQEMADEPPGADLEEAPAGEPLVDEPPGELMSEAPPINDPEMTDGNQLFLPLVTR